MFPKAARKRSNDPRFGFQHPDARALPFADGSFDRAFSMLVLSFITDIEHAVAEMRRVVRPGRTVLWNRAVLERAPCCAASCTYP